jgi:hypothetical protein
MAMAVRSVSWHFASPQVDDFGDDALLFQSHRLFDGDHVEGVHAHLDVGDVHSGAVALDAHLHVEIDDPSSSSPRSIPSTTAMAAWRGS